MRKATAAVTRQRSTLNRADHSAVHGADRDERRTLARGK